MVVRGGKGKERRASKRDRVLKKKRRECNAGRDTGSELERF